MQKPTENDTVKTKEVKETKEKPPALSIEEQLANFKAVCKVPYTVKKNKIFTTKALKVDCPPDLIPDSVLRCKKEYEQTEPGSQKTGRFVYIRKKLKLYGLINEPKKGDKDYYAIQKAAKLERKQQLKELLELRKFKENIEKRNLL